jgi:RimK family alpha-L-glutamate ligase
VNAVILSARTGWHTGELCRALAERGHTGRVLLYENLVARLGSGVASNGRGGSGSSDGWTGDSKKESSGAFGVGGASGSRAGARMDGLRADGVDVMSADAVLARIIPGGSLEQVIFRVDTLHWIEERGLLVVNSPRTIERCVDKFYTSALMRDAGLPTPETVVCQGTDEAMDAVRALGDVVIKPIFGSLGQGMFRTDNPEVALRVVRTLDQVRAVFYVQQAIDHGGRDVRAFVVGGRVLGAIERRAAAGEWRTNVALGGTARAVNLSDEWAQMALDAAAVVGADYAGVDLLPSRDGRVFVLEVNGIPGWEGLQTATGIDIGGAIIDHVVTRLRNP